MHRSEELVWATGATRPAVTWREIVPEDVCALDLMLLEQPANQGSGGRGLWRSKRVRLAADVLDADGTVVGTHAMICAITVVDHLVDVAIAIDDVVCGNFPRVGFLKLRQ